MAVSLLAALSISDKVKTYGAYAGFAAILGLAVLSLLYFSQARELRRLRDWAGRAPERALEADQRAQVPAPRRPPGVPVRPVGAPRPATPPSTGAASPIPPARPAASAVASGLPSPGAAPGPASDAVAAPAASPVSAPASSPVSPPPAVAPATAAAAAPRGTTAPAAPSASSNGPAAPRASAPRADAAPAGSTVVRDAASPAAVPAGAVPVVDRPVTRAAALRGGGVSATALPARTPPPPRTTPPMPRREVPARRDGGAGSVPGRETPPAPAASARRRPRGRLAALVLGGLLAVAIVAVALTGILGGGHSRASHPGPATAASPSGSGASGRHQVASLTPAHITVAVLNGTSVAGLASAVADQLASGGYRKGIVTNAATQQHQATTVSYAPGRRPAAEAVAQAISVAPENIQALDPATRVLGRGATVVVTVGSDRQQQR